MNHAERQKSAYLIKWNKQNRTVKVYDQEFKPRKVQKGRWVPDLLDRENDRKKG